ncbi:MAG TPA: glycosyltransferase, partial [Candidatus Saccharimonadales bacterium]|nr:glycosyltransferase [Candidatus Saccharimonadales bacterium]
RPFDFTTEVAKLYAVSDLVVSRAGASAIQELANSAKPAILIPAGLTDQKKNGQILDELGAALVADQDKLLNKPEEFIREIQFLLDDQRRRAELSERISLLAKPDTVTKIVEELLALKENK